MTQRNQTSPEHLAMPEANRRFLRVVPNGFEHLKAALLSEHPGLPGASKLAVVPRPVGRTAVAYEAPRQVSQSYEPLKLVPHLPENPVPHVPAEFTEAQRLVAARQLVGRQYEEPRDVAA